MRRKNKKETEEPVERPALLRMPSSQSLRQHAFVKDRACSPRKTLVKEKD